VWSAKEEEEKKLVAAGCVTEMFAEIRKFQDFGGSGHYPIYSHTPTTG